MYVNNLISLQENISTYGIENRKVTGHVTLSSPGMIKCYVQNLKTLPSGNHYVFCAFSKSRSRGIKVGKLGNEKETRWIVDETSILGSGLKLEEIDGVALVAENEMRGPEAAVIGFNRERYMLLSMIDDLFPRNEQKLTPSKSMPETLSKSEVSKSPVSVEKPKTVVPQEPGPVIIPCEEEQHYYADRPPHDGDHSHNGGKPHDGDHSHDGGKPHDGDHSHDGGKPAFVLPEGAVVGEILTETNEAPVNDELKRIIASISKDKRVEEKARELEAQISRMSSIPQSQKLFDKSQMQKTLETRYMSQKIDFDEMLNEEEEDSVLDTNPKKAVECINDLSQMDESLDSEAIEEIDYLKEIDKRLQVIRARMNETIEEQDIE